MPDDCRNRILMPVFQIENLYPGRTGFLLFLLPGDHTAVSIDNQRIIRNIFHHGHIFLTCKINGIDPAVQHKVKQFLLIHIGELADLFLQNGIRTVKRKIEHLLPFTSL